MTGKLFVIGLGPGGEHQVTPQAMRAVAEATHFFGYKPYIERLRLRTDQTPIESYNREELSRARAALEMAETGKSVAVVSGGDPGVFAMASAVCEAIDNGPESWRNIDLEIVPGVTAMLAVAATFGAPLGHDFCVMSLSDNLKPWEIIEQRLLAAAAAGFSIALYNPISKSRPWQLGRAFELVAQVLPPETPVMFGRAAGRPDEANRVTSLAQARPDFADMATCVIIGSAQTRLIPRPAAAPLVYAKRFVS